MYVFTPRALLITMIMTPYFDLNLFNILRGTTVKDKIFKKA